ncbi:MAG: carbohydrate-binding protein [Candidatus Nanopelagicales bacterium]
MTRIRRLLTTVTAVAVTTPGLIVTTATPSNASEGLKVVVVNNNPEYRADQVWVKATGNGAAAPELPLSQRSSFTLDSVSSGRVWVTLGKPLNSSTFPSPDTSDVRFDTVELTYPGVANLTAVDMLGIPMDIETFDAAGNLVASKKFACYTDVIQDTVKDRLTAAGGDYRKVVRTDANGNFLRLVSPNIVSGAHPSGYPRFESYISSLKGEQLTVRGTAMGKNYRYTGTFADDPHDPNGPGSIRLTDQGPDQLAPMYVKGSSLAGNDSNDTNGIYGNNSPYYVDGKLHSGNDVYGAVYRDLVAGFAYGFWGSPAYGNDSGRFDVSTAPGPFEGAQPDAANYNVWAAALWPITDAYGFPYGDTFNHQPDRNPIVELPTDGTLKITIDPDTSPAGCAGGTTPTPTPTPTPTVTTAPPATPTPTPTPTPTVTTAPPATSTPTPHRHRRPRSRRRPRPPRRPRRRRHRQTTQTTSRSTPCVRSAYERIEAEAPTATNGGVIDGGHVGNLGNGDWLEYGTVDFGSSGPYQVNSLVSGGSSGSGLVTYRVDSPTGPVVADFAIANTGGWNTYKQIPANAGGVTGEHKLYVTFTVRLLR